MNSSKKNQGDLEKLISDDFFIPYQRACEKAFFQIQIINIHMSQELGRNIVHFVKRRVKTPSSIYKKIQHDNLSLNEIEDIAGIRVVVHNKNDAYTLLKHIKSDDSIKIINVQDMIKNPKSDGYRSIHIQTEVILGEKTENEMNVPCEIQIRSIAEDLWATLSHREIYKDLELPEELESKMYELSNLLDGADSFAETIMELVEKEKGKGKIPVTPRKHFLELRENIRISDLIGFGGSGSSVTDYDFSPSINTFFEFPPLSDEKLTELAKAFEELSILRVGEKKKEKKKNK